LLAPARDELARRALPPCTRDVRVVAAQFGAEAGMVGAAALAWDGVARRSEVA
jgi:glucokinase